MSKTVAFHFANQENRKSDAVTVNPSTKISELKQMALGDAPGEFKRARGIKDIRLISMGKHLEPDDKKLKGAFGQVESYC